MQRLALGDVCFVDRQIVEPNSALANRLPYVGLEHVESGTGRLMLDAASDASVSSATFRFDSQHVLYGKLRPYLNKVALPDFEGRCTTELIPLRPKPGVLRDYLALVLRSERLVRASMRNAVGSRMPRADLDYLLNLEVDLPEPEDQSRLVTEAKRKLREVESACSGMNAQLTAARQLIDAALREEFGPRPVVATRETESLSHAWRWLRLQDLARLESGHTPSRRRPEWWGGHVPWLALPDIRKLHGKFAYETTEHINDAGLANSSARLLPVGTVCLCRDASIGFVTILGRPMATSQHFCNWICDPERLDPEFLMYAFIASHDYLRELGSGSVLKTIYMPTIQSFHVCAPEIDEQRRIARSLSDRVAAAEELTADLQARLAEIELLPQRLLAAAFGAPA